MLKTVDVVCPECKCKLKLHMSVDPKLALIKCPSCGTPIVLEDDNAAVAPDLNYDKLPYHSIREILEKIFKTAKLDKMNGEFIHEHRSEITDDDILNLKIELARCNDVEEFIGRM